MGSSAGAEWLQPQVQYFNMVGDALGTSVANDYIQSSTSYSLSSALKQ